MARIADAAPPTARDPATDPRLLAIGLRDEQPCADVREQSSATGQREDHERNAHDQRIDIEVVGDPASHARNDVIVGAAVELPSTHARGRLRTFGCVGGLARVAVGTVEGGRIGEGVVVHGHIVGLA